MREENIVVSLSHTKPDLHHKTDNWADMLEENFHRGFTLTNLPPYNVTYQRNSWPSACVLNGSHVKVNRREGAHLIVELDNGDVRHPCHQSFLAGQDTVSRL